MTQYYSIILLATSCSESIKTTNKAVKLSKDVVLNHLLPVTLLEQGGRTGGFPEVPPSLSDSVVL